MLKAVFLTWLAGLGAVGAALSFIFERATFGTLDPRPGYLVLYALLLGGCAVGSIIAWRWLLPGARGWAPLALVTSVVASAVLLGVTGL